MSIEKLNDASKVVPENCPYTQIPNVVIENIKDNDAFRLYAYLLSKSRDWVVCKEWTRTKCGIGQKKARSCWGYLERCGLLEYIKIKNDKGIYVKHDLKILNGSKFDPNEPFIREKQSTGAETASVDSIHWGKNPLSGQSTPVDFASQLKKDINTTKKKEKKKESYKPKNRSPVLQTYPKDFFPDEKRRTLLYEVCNKTNNPDHELLDKFESVSLKYKTRSQEWQQTFEEFLMRELPKRTYEDEKGKKRRYDGQSLY